MSPHGQVVGLKTVRSTKRTGDIVGAKANLVIPVGLRKVSDGIYHFKGKDGKAVIFGTASLGNFCVVTAYEHRGKAPSW